MSSENETFYDNVILPSLQQLAKECQARGMSFVATVEYDSGDTGSTILLTEGSGYHAKLMCAAAESAGNVDSLIFAIMKHARKHGHNSICLQQLGVSSVPIAETVQ